MASVTFSSPVTSALRHLFATTTRNGICVDPAFTEVVRHVTNDGRLKPHYGTSKFGRPVGILMSGSSNVTEIVRRTPEAFLAGPGRTLIEICAPQLEASTLALLSRDENLMAFLAADDPWAWLTSRPDWSMSRHDTKRVFFSWLWSSRISKSIAGQLQAPGTAEAAMQQVNDLFGRASKWLNATSVGLPEEFRQTALRERHAQLMTAAGATYQGVLGQIGAALESPAQAVLLTADVLVVECASGDTDRVANVIREVIDRFLAVELGGVASRVDIAAGPNLNELLPAA
jgi:hypothetical protein